MENELAEKEIKELLFREASAVEIPSLESAIEESPDFGFLLLRNLIRNAIFEASPEARKESLKAIVKKFPYINKGYVGDNLILVSLQKEGKDKLYYLDEFVEVYKGVFTSPHKFDLREKV